MANLTGQTLASTYDDLLTKGSGTTPIQDGLGAAYFYEEGTFTPTIIGSTGAGVGTYTTQVGRYAKMGKRVQVDIALSWTAHTGTGFLRVSNLPYIIRNIANYTPSASIGFISNISLTANNIATAYGETGQANIIIVQTPVGGGATTSLPIDSSGTIYLSINYETTT